MARTNCSCGASEQVITAVNIEVWPNGIKALKLNDKEEQVKTLVNGSGSSEQCPVSKPETETESKVLNSAESQAKEVEEKIDPGKDCSAKNLYRGKEDDEGRFKWQDTIPEDVGEAVENAKTAKHALLVRHVKVYGDPRKVLAIHSIVVQSPYLRTLLRKVLRGYPGLALNLQRLEIGGKFEPIIHRWAALQKAIADLTDKSEDERETKKHADLLMGVLKPEFSETIETSQDMILKGLITFEYLWTLFHPSCIVFCENDKQDTALRLLSSKYGLDSNSSSCFWLRCEYIDWDGTQFGSRKIQVKMPYFSGTQKISDLDAYPIDHHPEKTVIRQKLLKRGARWEKLAGTHYKSYDGIGTEMSYSGQPQKFKVRGRIVVDGKGYQDFNPNKAFYVDRISSKEGKDTDDADAESTRVMYGESNHEDSDDYEDDGYSEGGYYHNSDECLNNDDNKVQTLTDEQRIISTPTVRGYSLNDKTWMNLNVDSVKDVSFNEQAFERLVLPSSQKELILGFTEAQKAYKDCFDDIIEGKGKGIILLLSGPPGVGKTLTAESVAEEMKVPMYGLSAGDLGIVAYDVENKLKGILAMCTRWNAVLLIDEADIFLEERSLHELERNKLVTIFLKVIEYYEGIMFLTTNRVNTFDAAFQSRIHISIDYPELTIESRRTVWNNFLSVSLQENNITSKQLDALALMQMNGRQIKNVLKTAQLLARRKGNVLSHQHILTVLDVTQHLHNSTRETERNRSAIFC